MPTRINNSERLPGLDLLRTIAIIWVMLFHSFLLGGLGPDWSWLSRFGWMGVDLFFVLSGFLIGIQVLTPLARGKKLSFSDFYLRRAFRILPAYWAVLLLYLLWPSFREEAGMESGWKFLTFITNVSIDYRANAAFSHAWSLCVEEHFYLFFPLLAVIFFRRPSMLKFVLFVTMVIVAGVILRAVIWQHGMDSDPSFIRNWFVEDIYYPTWNRLDGLLCGVMLAAWKVMRPQSWQRARRYANYSLIAGITVMSLVFWIFQNRVGLIANSIGWPILAFGLGLIVFAGAGRDSVIGRYKVPFTGWFAAISYSLYLMHKATYHLVQQQWGDLLLDRGFLAFIVYGCAAIMAGAILHYIVERPCLKLRGKITLRRRDELISNPT